MSLESPKANFYVINKKYAFTLNPCDKYQYFGKQDRYKKFHNFIYELFVANNMEYELFIEISEPRDQKRHCYAGARLHIHGTIMFRKKKELQHFLLHGYTQICKIGTTEIDSIDDLDKWMEYCKKQDIFIHRRISNYVV